MILSIYGQETELLSMNFFGGMLNFKVEEKQCSFLELLVQYLIIYINVT
jgi:hypothetical protein